MPSPPTKSPSCGMLEFWTKILILTHGWVGWLNRTMLCRSWRQASVVGSLANFANFLFLLPTFAASFYDHLVPRTTKHLKWKLANVYTLRCQPVWKTLVEYIMDEEISSSQWWVSNRFKQLLYVFPPIGDSWCAIGGPSLVISTLPFLAPIPLMMEPQSFW